MAYKWLHKPFDGNIFFACRAIDFIERINMQKTSFLLIAISGLLLLACAEKDPVYPWITDVNTEVAANGKMIGYEFTAKW